MATAAGGFLQRLSLDRAGVAVVVTGCMATLIHAQMEGRAPLKGEIPARDFYSQSSKNNNNDNNNNDNNSNLMKENQMISSAQCRSLEQNGFLIIDNFLSPEQVREACESIRKLDQEGKFHASPAHDDITQDQTTDRIHICRQDTSGKLDHVRQSLGQFASSIVKSDFGGFIGDDDEDDYGNKNDKHSLKNDDIATHATKTTATKYYESGELQVPAHMQVSIYGGKGTNATYNFYNLHLDSADSNSFIRAGLLGWLRSCHLRKRYLSCIVYLNEDWKESDGGCLRLFPTTTTSGRTSTKPDESSSEVLDVEPIAGRLVVLSSLQQWRYFPQIRHDMHVPCG